MTVVGVGGEPRNDANMTPKWWNDNGMEELLIFAGGQARYRH